MRDFVRKPQNWVVVCLVLCFLLALLYSLFAAANTNLPSYVQQETEPEETSKIPHIDTIKYQAEDIALSMLVPAEWTQITKNGHAAFVNALDGACVHFEIGGYVPSINMVTQDLVSEDISRLGGTLMGFTKLSNSSHLVVYELDTAIYFEYSSWDLNTFVRVFFQIPSARYTHYYDTVIYLFDTLVWEKESPLPISFSLFYSSYGNFEFGVPDGWNATILDGNYIATSPSGSTLSVTVSQSAIDLSDISQLDYVDAASHGRQEYMLRAYSNTGTMLASEASYTANGESWYSCHQMVIHHGYLYEIAFDCPLATYDSESESFITSLSLFRIFD